MTKNPNDLPDTPEQARAKAMLRHFMTPEGLAEFRQESRRALKEYRSKQKQTSTKKK